MCDISNMQLPWDPMTDVSKIPTHPVGCQHVPVGSFMLLASLASIDEVARLNTGTGLLMLSDALYEVVWS